MNYRRISSLTISQVLLSSNRLLNHILVQSFFTATVQVADCLCLRGKDTFFFHVDNSTQSNQRASDRKCNITHAERGESTSSPNPLGVHIV